MIIGKRFALILLGAMTTAFTPSSGIHDAYPIVLAQEEPVKPSVTTAPVPTTPVPPTALEPLTIFFYGPVTESSCFQLTSTLKAMDQKAKGQRIQFPKLKPCINLHIQSTGGTLLPTFYVCDVLRDLDTDVKVFVDGYAASAASLIAVSAKRRAMTRHSAMLIHQLTGAARGKFHELKDEMTNLRFFMDTVKSIYLDRTNLDEARLEELLSSDVWLDAETCLEYGVVDEIL